MNTVTQSPTNDFSNLSEVLWDACKRCPGQMILDKKATRDWGRPVYRCLQCGYQDTDRAPTQDEMEETHEETANNTRDKREEEQEPYPFYHPSATFKKEFLNNISKSPMEALVSNA